MRTLGELIDTLKAHDPDLPVLMDGATGLGFVSWRGVYAEVSITHGSTRVGSGMEANREYGFTFTEPTGDERIAPATTVGELLAAADAVDGGVLEGYKGGAYWMDRSTTLWADPYGECPGSYVNGVTVTDGGLELNRVDNSYGDES